MKKFELTENFKVNAFGVKLFQIKALRSFASINEGELGGYVEKEDNLDHDGDAWVCGDAEVYGDAKVCGDAWVCGDAEVYGDAKVCGDAWVCGDAKVYGNAEVCGNAKVYGDAWVCGDAKVYGNADYCCFQSFGSTCRTTTVSRNKEGGVTVVCGCFTGTLDEFAAKVQETHGDSRYGREYRAIIEVIKIKFGMEK